MFGGEVLFQPGQVCESERSTERSVVHTHDSVGGLVVGVGQFLEQARAEVPALAVCVCLLERLAAGGVVEESPADLLDLRRDFLLALKSRLHFPARRRLRFDRRQQDLGDLLFLGRQLGQKTMYFEVRYGDGVSFLKVDE